MARQLGQLESAALAYVQMRNCAIVRAGDMVKALRFTAKQERELLSRMARTGLVARVRNGLYLFPLKLPLGGVWTPDEAVVINTLMADRQARYQITGPSAFNRYGFDEQIPSRITLYNSVISGERSVGSNNFTLIKVDQQRLGDIEEVSSPSGQTLVYSSRVRTLVDAVYDWSRFDSLPRAYSWIRSDLKAGRMTAIDLVKTAIRYGNLGTIRRIGALLDQMGTDKNLLKRLQRAISTSTAKIPLIPGRPAHGALMERWGVVNNG